MGNNVDLCQMLNAPEKADCQHCSAPTKTYFDDYDIECGDPNPAPGKWRLHYYCHLCEHDSYWERVLQPVPGPPQPSKEDLVRLAKELDKLPLLAQVKHPTTVEEGPNGVVFFRDADHHIFMSMPKEVYLDLLARREDDDECGRT